MVPLLALGLLLALIWTDDYGMSADEHVNAAVGSDTLLAYTSAQAYSSYMQRNDLGHHGPAYFMMMAATSEVLRDIVPAWLPADARHLSNFITFLLAGLGVYVLCLRLLPRSVALVTTAFFLTQPLLFGHGFINQKDTPFMAFFLLTVVAGLAGVDRLATAGTGAGNAGPMPESPRRTLRLDLRSAPWGWKLVCLGWTAAFTWLLVDLLYFGDLLDLAKSVVTMAHTQQAWEPINRVYAFIAEDAQRVEVSVYHEKVEFAYLLIGRIAVTVSALGAGVLLGRKALPRTLHTALPGPAGAYAWLLISAGLLGFSVSIRPLGGFAGLLVSIYLAYRLRSRSGGPLLVFWAVAAVVTYATWPWLWPTPIPRLRESVQLALDFPAHLTLFGGTYLPSNELPASYLPRLLSAQLTEPALLLIPLGGALALLLLARRGAAFETLLILLAWFFLPAAYVVARQPSIYNNFRQLLFILPPAFVLAGLAVDWIFRHVRSPIARIGLAALILFPGVLGIVRLHPYEYIYYNSTVGGVRGAAGRFELDYWCTSYREAMEQVNREAPANARIAVGPPVSAARTFARADLHVDAPYAFDEPFLTLVCDPTRGSSGVDLGRPVVYQVRVDGVDLAKILRGDTGATGDGSP